MQRSTVFWMVVALGLGGSACAQGTSYPEKPIRFILDRKSVV